MNIEKDPLPAFEIHDPAIDVRAIMEKLQMRLQQRRAEAGSQGLDYDALLELKGLAELRRLQDLSENLWVSVEVRDQHLPIFNAVFMRVKRAFHELVALYVNMLAGRQIAVNIAMARTLTDLAKLLEQYSARVQALEEQSAELRQRVRTLEGHRTPSADHDGPH